MDTLLRVWEMIDTAQKTAPDGCHSMNYIHRNEYINYYTIRSLGNLQETVDTFICCWLCAPPAVGTCVMSHGLMPVQYW